MNEGENEGRQEDKSMREGGRIEREGEGKGISILCRLPILASVGAEMTSILCDTYWHMLYS